MRAAIDELLEASGDVCTREELLAVATRNQLDDEISRGLLVRLAPHTYSRPWQADLDACRELAAVKSVGTNAALSHTTALVRWGLLARRDDIAIHVTTTRPRRIERDAHPSVERPGVIVHRTHLPVQVARVGSARTVTPSWAILGSWPMLSGSARRNPTITAVRRRLVTVDQLRTALGEQTRLRDRAALLSLVDLIESGCQSELEIWGYLKVFDAPGLRGAIRQRTVAAAGRVYRLDLAYEREQVAVELDGRAFHSSPMQWERDIARDLALATLGWQTVRLSHRRLTTDIDGCRRDILAVLARRRTR